MGTAGRRAALRAGTVAIGIALAVAGCSDDSAPGSVDEPTESETASSGEPLTAPVLEGAVGARQVRVTLDGLTVAGDDAVLEATVEVLGDDDGGESLGFAFSGAVQSGAVDEPRLVDLTTGVVHEVARDAEGDCVCTRGPLDLEPGVSTPVQMVFAAPEPGVEEIAVLWPHLGLAEGVPVRDGDLPAPHAEDAGARTTPPDPADVVSALVALLESYSQTPDESVRTRGGGELITVELAADVLFAVDSAEIVPGASQALDLAAAQVLARGPGDLSVVGHTDDTGDEAYNLDLSRRRAEAVAAAAAVAGTLDPLQPPVTVEGRGEAEPSVPGTSAEARRLNRRVTLVHTLDAAPPEGGQVAAEAGEPPPTSGVTGTGAEGVQLTEGSATFRVSAPGARRAGDVLVVDLLVEVDGPEPALAGGLLASGAFSARGDFDAFSQYSSVGVRLVGASTQTYSLDYVVQAPEQPDDVPSRTCPCDRWQNLEVPPGVASTVTVVFPDPGPDVGSVVIEVEDAFRLTDVPVR